MKLLYCPNCHDVFNLRPQLKTCSCGQVKGRYIDNVNAEVNGKGVSLGMGNGSFMVAVAHAPYVREDFRNTGDVYRRHDTSIVCWARPHEGPANSHTRVNPDL